MGGAHERRSGSDHDGRAQRHLRARHVRDVALEPAAWSALEAEACDAGLTVAQLLARASLALAADIDSGRVAAQIFAETA